MANFREFIGKGLQFPFEFSQRTGGVSKIVDDGPQSQLQKIRDSIIQILGVKIGEMFFARDFGSSLREQVFRIHDDSNTLVQFFITEALEKWEKRITLNRLEVRRDQNDKARILISMEYTIRKTNVSGNLVYPLYLENSEIRSRDFRG